jgi:hypothetical protein
MVGGILASKRGETQLRNPEYNPTACNIHCVPTDMCVGGEAVGSEFILTENLYP